MLKNPLQIFADFFTCSWWKKGGNICKTRKRISKVSGNIFQNVLSLETDFQHFYQHTTGILFVFPER